MNLKDWKGCFPVEQTTKNNLLDVLRKKYNDTVWAWDGSIPTDSNGLDRAIKSSKKLIAAHPDIILFPSEVLTRPCIEADFVAETYNANEADFLGYMRKIVETTNSLGLSAPQVGVLARMFVMRNPKTNVIFEVVNPLIIAKTGTVFRSVEGCLSLPGELYSIRRHKEIIVEYTDKEGSRHKQVKFKGDLAVIFQHEYDHLAGVLINKRGEKVNVQS